MIAWCVHAAQEKWQLPFVEFGVVKQNSTDEFVIIFCHLLRQLAPWLAASICLLKIRQFN